MADGFLETDQDYIDAGVAPPEHNPHGIEGDDNEAVIARINASGLHLHEWVAKGNVLECSRGGHIHGMGYDHLHKILVGTDGAGNPIFKTLDLDS